MRNRFLKELKVLLVEDEKRVATLFKNAIGENFKKFYVAKDGLNGLEKFKKLNPDIVITDINMPALSGLEMAKKIRDIDKEIPIIILSAYSETDKFLKAIDIGVVKYFIKPYDPDELLDYIDSIEEKFKDKIVMLKDGFSFNKSSKNLYKNYKYIPLSQRESEFMQLLLENHEIITDNQTLKEKLWDDEVSDERLRTFIRRFREKTSKNLILNVKGQGYKITLLSGN